MKRNNLYLLFLATIISACITKSTVELDNAQYIDPFICTANDHGQTDVAAALPFGMVKPCPDTDPIAHSGYDYASEYIKGFSHTRFSGVGCRGVGGNIRVLPVVDSLVDKLKYNKETEFAEAGYYKVELINGVKAELTATNQVAFHKYTFPKSDHAGLTIDLASSFAGHISETHSIDDDGIIFGKVNSVNVCRLGKYSFYYALHVDKAYKEVELDSTNILLQFTTDNNEVVHMYCALSVISESEAINKLKVSKEQSFENIKKNAYLAWNELVNVVEVETDDISKKRLFYTHLYHATQSPFMINEEDGTYRGSDNKLYNCNQSTYYHGWSIWDTFRSKLPLLSFLYPEHFSDMMTSISELYAQGKPDWGTETEPFITIRTEHSLVMILDAYQKGLLQVPLEEVYPHLQQEVLNLPFKSPDNVLESSYDLWALSVIASEIGHTAEAEEYLNQAMNYQKVWKDKFMVMDENSDIMHGDDLYEGTLWQYRWFVPYDIAGIQQFMGGKDEFENQLDYFFDNELFNIGNQPGIQVPYLYAYTSSPWKIQALIHSLINEETNNWYGTHHKLNEPIRKKIFTDTPEGYIREMDDDAGTMASWYVWSALGLYPVFPGTTDLVITAPQFDSVKINLKDATINIKAIRRSADAKYIQNVSWNGSPHNSCFIDFRALVKGGDLIIELGEEPNKQWGINQ